MRPKSHELPVSTQAAIGRAYVDGKRTGRDVTYRSLAAKWNCTADQVRAYARKYSKGAYRGKQGKARTSAPPETGATIESIIQSTLEELAVADLNPLERASAVRGLADSLKTMQTIGLQGHLRAIDAKLISGIIRRFAPEATDADIIAIIREERERVILGD